MAAQFNQIFGNVISTAISWFERMLATSGYTGFYLAAIFLVFISKFLLSPIFGTFVAVSASDTVRTSKENRRYKGSFEKNNKGRYVKK